MPATRSFRHRSPHPTPVSGTGRRRSQRLQRKLGLSGPLDHSVEIHNRGHAGAHRQNPSIMQPGRRRSERVSTQPTINYEESFDTGRQSSSGSIYAPSTDISSSISDVSASSTDATPPPSMPSPSMTFVHPHGVKDREGFIRAPRHFLQIFCLATLIDGPDPSLTIEEAMLQEREERRLHLLKYPGWNMRPKRSFGVQTED